MQYVSLHTSSHIHASTHTLVTPSNTPTRSALLQLLPLKILAHRLTLAHRLILHDRALASKLGRRGNHVSRVCRASALVHPSFLMSCIARDQKAQHLLFPCRYGRASSAEGQCERRCQHVVSSSELIAKQGAAPFDLARVRGLGWCCRRVCRRLLRAFGHLPSPTLRARHPPHLAGGRRGAGVTAGVLISAREPPLPPKRSIGGRRRCWGRWLGVASRKSLF